ncbi:unnamed protein product [Acanthoscelides obtectus]|uniref:Uncharacterized protein n=1 Tax=Acanthoscelides obtectus TaxID=200917 RepID=A0A9P0KLQ4_ACAOB|nr:unnamed protein product [Acanthoscelides obtectus]CAK1655806.1 hypothetical protein AOBTE_LOCUS19351 [Acanthoscelides obtectus]
MDIRIDNVKLQQVHSFKYLGFILEPNGRNEIQISERVGKANNLYYAMSEGFINKKDVSKKTKITVYNTIYRSILTYRCESWVLAQQQKSKLQAVEMKYLRRVKGVTKMDKIRNETIKTELQTESILEHIEMKQLRW